MSRKNTWDTTRTGRLRELVIEGLTASEIGLELNCSRNAVIGKCHRVGVTIGEHKRTRPKEKRMSGPPPSKPRPLRKPPARKVSAVREPPAEEKIPADPERVIIYGAAAEAVRQLDPSRCRYPVGDPMTDADFRFCGAPVLTGRSSYCPEHHQTCHTGNFRKPLHASEAYEPPRRELS